MSRADRGSYIDLMAWSWDNGPLPLSVEARANLAGCSRKEFRAVWQVVGKKWHKTTLGYVNKRLEETRSALFAYSQKQAENGRKGGAVLKRRSSTALARGGPNTSSPISDLQDQDQNLDQELGARRADGDE